VTRHSNLSNNWQIICFSGLGLSDASFASVKQLADYSYLLQILCDSLSVYYRLHSWHIIVLAAWNLLHHHMGVVFWGVCGVCGMWWLVGVCGVCGTTYVSGVCGMYMWCGVCCLESQGGVPVFPKDYTKSRPTKSIRRTAARADLARRACRGRSRCCLFKSSCAPKQQPYATPSPRRTQQPSR
jgi:hypothetical protein